MSVEKMTTLDLLYCAIRILKQHHDTVDSAGDDRPTPLPNWAMRATNTIEEAMELVDKGMS